MKIIKLATALISISALANSPQVNIGDIIDPSICKGQGYLIEEKKDETWGNLLVKESMFERTFKFACKNSTEQYIVSENDIGGGYINGYKVYSIFSKTSLVDLHFSNFNKFIQYRDGAVGITRHQVFFPKASSKCAKGQSALAYTAMGKKVHGAYTSAYRAEFIDYGVTETSICLNLEGVTSSLGGKQVLTVLDEFTDGFDTYALIYGYDGDDYDPGVTRDELVVIKMDRAHPVPVITLEQKLTTEIQRLTKEIGGCHYDNNFATAKLLTKDKVLLKFGGAYSDPDLVTLDFSNPGNIVQKDINRVGDGSSGGFCYGVGIGGAMAVKIPYLRDDKNGLYKNNSGELVYKEGGQEIKI